MSEEINETSEEKKSGGGLEGLSMTKADVLRLADNLTAMVQPVKSAIEKLGNGEGYSEAVEAILAFADEMLFGTLYEFREKNQWLKGIDYGDIDKLVDKDNGYTPEDLMYVLEMWRILNGKGGEHLSSIYQYIQEMTGSGKLQMAYRVMREDMIMRSEMYSELQGWTDEAFEQYADVMGRYGKTSIYNKLTARKEKPYDMNLALITDDLLIDFKEAGVIGEIFHDTLGYVDPYWYNYFTTLDHKTKKLSELPDHSRFDEEKIRIAELVTNAGKYFDGLGDKTVQISKAIAEVMSGIKEVFIKARDTLTAYRFNGDGFPYTLARYSSSVKNVGGSIISLKDPVTGGTQYAEMIQAMLRKCRKTVEDLAKNAP